MGDSLLILKLFSIAPVDTHSLVLALGFVSFLELGVYQPQLVTKVLQQAGYCYFDQLHQK